MVVIIDYGMGNVASVKKAFIKLGAQATISKNVKEIENAKCLVLPGVGAFGDGMKNLKSLELIEPMHKKVVRGNTPFLGICLGMQLLAETGFEFGRNAGLGWIKGEVKKLEIDKNLRLPHVGWNNVEVKIDNILFQDITDSNFYFVHSYHLKCSDQSIVTSTCEYGQPFTASIHQDNIFATQFHPEKSQVSGLKLIKNFLDHSKNA